MEIAAAAILGLIQGLTEFLPISSSAHLILVPWFLGWKPEGLAFDVALHVGTAAAILAYFWKDWYGLAREAIRGIVARDPLGNSERKLAWLLAAGSVPAAVLGLLFKRQVEETLRSPLITFLTLSLFGLLLYWADRRSRRDRNLAMFTWGDSILIGFGQALALIPGISRSGITITAALMKNADRVSAARFSFLLATPVIAGAGILEGWELVGARGAGGAGAGWAVIAVGTATAGITGFLCIRLFLRYLQTRTFVPFVIYRLLLAVLVLIYYLEGSGA